MKGLDNVTIMGILQTKYRKNVYLKMIDYGTIHRQRRFSSGDRKKKT